MGHTTTGETAATGRAPLTHPEQIRIMRAVTSLGSAPDTQIADVTGLPQATVSQHLHELTQAALMERPHRHYRLTDAGIEAVINASGARPPLTFANVEHDFTPHYGHHAVAVGEDWENVVIVGHLEPLHAIGIARHVIRVDTNGDITRATNVRHIHAEFAECWHGVDEHGWVATDIGEPADNSTPLTIVDVEV